MNLNYKKLWKSIKLFFFHLWYGKDAFKLLFASNAFRKGDILSYNAQYGEIIILSNSRYKGIYFEYVVKSVKEL